MIGPALRALPLMAVLAGGIGGDGLASSLQRDGAPHPHWTEVSWPFPIDQWGTGRAFQCAADACGVVVNLYLRPKIGFCNCAKGVYDDAELDRVSDVDVDRPGLCRHRRRPRRQRRLDERAGSAPSRSADLTRRRVRPRSSPSTTNAMSSSRP